MVIRGDKKLLLELIKKAIQEQESAKIICPIVEEDKQTSEAA